MKTNLAQCTLTAPLPIIIAISILALETPETSIPPLVVFGSPRLSSETGSHSPVPATVTLRETSNQNICLSPRPLCSPLDQS